MKPNQVPPNVAAYVQNGLKIMLWLFMGTAVFIFIIHSTLATIHPYPLDYGEAPLVDQARRLADGENIYQPDLETPPYTIANYPPLYILTLTPFAHSAPFQMGRLISVLAAVGSAVFLALIVLTLSQNRLAALATGTLFLAIPYVVHWSGLARIDLLALLLATAALYVSVRWGNGRWGLITAAILLVAAAYTRQSYALAAPLGAFLWLWQQERQRAYTLAGIVAGLGIGLFVLINLLTDGGFYTHIITANVNAFDWGYLGDRLAQLASDLPLAILLALALLLGGRIMKGWELLLGFVIGSFLSALTIGKVGSNVKYFLELAAALSLAAGVLLAGNEGSMWRYTAVLALIILQMGMALSTTMTYAVDERLTPHRNDLEAVRRVQQWLQPVQGTVLADEYMGLLTLLDRPLYLQPFEMSQLANEGKWDQQPLLNAIANQEFAGILIHHFGPFPVFRERWTPEMLAAIEQHYRPERTMAGTVIFVPQQEAGVTPIPAPTTTTFNANLSLNIPQLVSQASHLFQPVIAINQVNPQQIAIISTSGPNQQFTTFDRGVDLLLFTSSNGGATWSEQAPISSARSATFEGTLAFAPDGTLFVMGVRDGEITINSAIRETNYDMTLGGQLGVTRAQEGALPHLQIDPNTGDLYLSIDAQEADLYDTPAFIRSGNGGQSWSTTTRVDQHVALADLGNGRATWPDDIQLLFGEDNALSMVWVWDQEPWIWPRDVWLANASDGQTFAEPMRIAESWGRVSAASNNGRYAIAYRRGTETEQQLAIPVTEDNGRSWTSSIASGSIPLYFDPDKGAGLSMAPDGTIDVTFYAAETADCALTLEQWRYESRFSWQDTCTYHVYYTFSRDGGQSFSEPVRLNETAIQGAEFVIVNGRSTPGTHLSLASTNEVAYPVWIDGGQVYLLGIER
jgi:hypothetical protein